jgi:uncharacterized protein YqjF (DUF2071 family)
MSFLTAEWRWLAMANYAVDPGILSPYLPAETELDRWEGRTYVSLVGFLFLDTRIKGLPVPFYHKFEEVNLRFYVRHRTPEGGWRRGVVFIREFVPSQLIAFVANQGYGEHYRNVPMRHDIHRTDEALTVQYEWNNGGWNSFCVVADPEPRESDPQGMDAFITEHYYGYTRMAARRTSEYHVEHPTWKIFPVQGFEIKVDFRGLYGDAFAFLEGRKPVSVLLAEGSGISVGAKRVIKNPGTNIPNP